MALSPGATALTEPQTMLMVLGLIDVVMIANLLIMVIVGGYETFVLRLDLEDHPDQPEWLSHVNAGVLKVKLATALIGISSIHLLQTFIESDSLSDRTIFWQVMIHLTLVVSAFMLAWTDRVATGVREGAEAGRAVTLITVFLVAARAVDLAGATFRVACGKVTRTLLFILCEDRFAMKKSLCRAEEAVIERKLVVPDNDFRFLRKSFAR